MITFTFTYRKGFIPSLIRWFSKGKWSHVIIGVDGVFYEAIGGRIMGVNGCVMSPKVFSQHQGKYEPIEYETIIIDNEPYQRKEVLKFLDNQVGRRYDYLGFLSFGFRFLQGKANSYYCSELALKAYGIIKGVEYKQQYTPDELYELVK
jgi:hypothetical protein